MTCTKAETCEKLGISRPTLDRYLAMDGAPKAMDRKWDVEAVAAFIQDQAGKAAEGSKDLKGLRAKKLMIDIERAMIALNNEKQLYYLRSEVQAGLRVIAEKQKAMLLEKLRNELPIKTEGLNVHQRMEVMEQFALDIMAIFESGVSKWN